MNLVFKYKVFPLSMGIVSMFLAITVVVQNIILRVFRSSALQSFEFCKFTIDYHLNRFNS